jgi:hypothetical protein
MNQRSDILPPDTIAPLIRTLRGQRVLLDADLAGLYGVPTFRFNEAVKRNLSRFPEDFMFRLTKEEWNRLEALRSQNAILKPGRGQHRKYPPCVLSAQARNWVSHRPEKAKVERQNTKRTARMLSGSP